MFFQISPVTHKKQPKLVVAEKVKEEEKPEILSLAPFTPNPKITFENVKIGTTEVRKMLIKNPTNQDIGIFVKRSVPDDLNLILSWQEEVIEKGQEKLLEMVWSPISELACRHTFVLSDGKKINRDVPVTFKSISSKPSQTKKLKQSQKKPKSPAIKLPLTRRNISPQKKMSKKSTQKSPRNPQSTQQFFLDHENKENYLHPNMYNNRPSNHSFMSPTNATFDMNHIKIEGRETFTIQNIKTERFASPLSEASFKDSLNNSTVSPQSNILTDRLDFENKLRQLDFTTSFTENSLAFSPTVISTASKNNSANNSLQLPQLSITRLFSEKNDTFTLSPKENVNNISTETYVKDKANLSSDTYVKSDLSSDTYVKADISSGTYVKDSSIGNLASFEFSPLSTLPVQRKSKSPVFLRPKSFDFTSPVDTNRYLTDKPKDLSCIVEESYLNETNNSVKVGGKRRASNVSATSFYTASPPKKPNIISDGIKDWSKKGGAAVRVAKKSTGLNLLQYVQNKEKSTQPVVTVSEQTTKTLIVQNPFLYANIIDPFMSSHIYANEEWFLKQEEHFKRWMNLLLTPPEEFKAEVEAVDVSKVWQECKKREVQEAPTKEELSNKYHSSARLVNLRLQAQNLFRSKEISDVLMKVCASIEAGKLSVRQDKDFHLNLRLKSEVMSIFLSYNPLWLRIGLETIYNEVIPLKSNSDVAGLTHFLLERLFKDPYLLKKHKTLYSAKYSADLKKFFLKKFFVLVYFLDQAKNRKLIPHDPCLFCKKSEEKESRQVLLHFAREVLSAVGDITKFLRVLGYTVSHVQSYIHEFDYAVKNLGVDLRDGVRLAKVMEIIQLRDDLTSKLRVPAISRLQKVHNMDVVFTSLTQSRFEILYDIVPKDIVNGHREKTLSFLWQIVYKFEAPLLVKCATKVQHWYRSLPIVLKRRQIKKEYMRRDNAAKSIQGWYRRQILSRKLLHYAEILKKYFLHKKIVKSAIVIQSYYRMYICQKRYKVMYQTILKIQAISRGWLVRNRYFERIRAAKVIQKYYKGFIVRKKYLKLKEATLVVQRKYRAKIAMKKEKEHYNELKVATRRIQDIFRANKLMKLQREEYYQLKTAAIKVQSTYRMILQRKKYLQLQKSTLAIQRLYRALRAMRNDREAFLTLKRAVISVQRRFRAKLRMMIEHSKYNNLKVITISIQSQWRMIVTRRHYLQLKNATVSIQRHYRALVLMKKERAQYVELKKMTICVQHRFRATRQMKIERENYLRLRKAAILVQSQYRMKITKRKYAKLLNATFTIQRKYRALISSRKCRSDYLKLKEATINVQNRYRAKLKMKTEYENYTRLKIAAVTIQSQYRMITTRRRYLQLQKAALTIQQRYRALTEMKKATAKYQALKKAVTSVQRRYRAKLLMRVEQGRYEKLKSSAIVIQSQYKMIITRRRYLQLKEAAITLQKRYSALIAMRKDRAEFLRLKRATILIQTRFRATLQMRIYNKQYEKLKRFTILIQSQYRMILTRRRYLLLRKSAVVIQRRFRALIDMKNERSKYIALKSSTVNVQRRFRAKLLMKVDRDNYLKLRTASITIQSYYRMFIIRRRYLQLSKAAVVIQRRYRAQKCMKMKQIEYVKIKNATLSIQRRFRSNLLSKKIRTDYLELKRATTNVQRRFRANKLMQIERQHYIDMRNASAKIQMWYRSIIVMRVYRSRYQNLKRAVLFTEQKYIARQEMLAQMRSYNQLKTYVVLIQKLFRATREMRKERSAFQSTKTSAIVLQRRFRAMQQMKQDRLAYTELKLSVTRVQARFRANLAMRKERQTYVKKKSAAIKIQNWFRATLEMRKYREHYLALKIAVTIFEDRYISKKQMIKQRCQYEELRKSVISVQQRYRANILMKRDRLSFCKLRSTVIYLQQRFKANKVVAPLRIQYLKLRQAAIVIQQRYRAQRLSIEARQEYVALKKSTVFVQRRFREIRLTQQLRRDFLLLRRVTINIQRRYRAQKLMVCQRIEYNSLRQSVVAIQQRFRGNQLVAVERERYILLRDTVIWVQRRFRALREVKTRLRKLRESQNQAATKIQALWRGYKVRSSNKPEVVTIKERKGSVQIKCGTPISKTLAQRCEIAMRCVIGNATLIQIVRALEDLDFITRHCRKSCMELSQILPAQLYVVIEAAARSLPEMQCCNVSAFILINFCKYPATMESSWDPRYMDKILNVMLHWCDKEAPLFSSLCTLLWLFAHKQEWKEFILNIPNLRQRLLKMRTLVLRKQTMVAKIGKTSSLVCYFSSNYNKALPTRFANWGLDYDRPNAFTNAVHAVNSLVTILECD